MESFIKKLFPPIITFILIICTLFTFSACEKEEVKLAYQEKLVGTLENADESNEIITLMFPIEFIRQ